MDDIKVDWIEYKRFLEESLKEAERKYFESKIAFETIKNQVDSLDINMCPICGNYFNKVKRQEYCSNACKSKAYRIRKETSGQSILEQGKRNGKK